MRRRNFIKGIASTEDRVWPICDRGGDELGVLSSPWLALSLSGPQTHDQ
jgi:hypothetical protein